MIIKYPHFKSDEIFLVDASGSRGVGFLEWKSFKEYNDVYTEVFYRKLITNRDNEFMRKFE